VIEETDRDDRVARGYDRWWAPVLAPSAGALLDRLEPAVVDGARDILDVGIGTGNLALSAVQRWPDVTVVGVDASSEMVRTVVDLAADRLTEGERSRFNAQVGFADQLPVADASFDVAMSSFVLQLVPSRPEALRDIHRALRPGGLLSYVTWLRDERAFAPDRVFDQLLGEYGFDDEEPDPRSGDVPSPTAAAAELRRAGFTNVTAEAALLEHAFTVDGYISFLVEFDEETMFEEMDRRERHRFLAQFRERLMHLDPDELVFRVPIVYAAGRRAAARS
jgi:ubiquinone/menaquinone biosynthesis C-methylase UbiE